MVLIIKKNAPFLKKHYSNLSIKNTFYSTFILSKLKPTYYIYLKKTPRENTLIPK
jgi:hypothetical protein